MNTKLLEIAQCFQLSDKVAKIKALGEGFINDTYIVQTHGDTSDNYIMQRKNKNVFKDIPAMMDNIQRVCQHIKEKVIVSGGDPMHEVMTLIETKDQNLYYKDSDGEFWTVCIFISGSVSYQAIDSPELAFSGGKAIGKFQCMTSDFSGHLSDILPGFHNIRFRLKQWDEVLRRDPVGRKKELTNEINWIEGRRDEMLKFWSLVEDGIIPTRITHNDTKISNILFDEKGEALCVIDLDTVLSSTVLNDFGDAVRSYTNTGLEDDTDLKNVSMDMTIFKAYAEGYLSEAKSFLIPLELEYLAFSALYITYEQVLRFLMDYIDGDNYYKIKYESHNLIRCRAQYKLLTSIEEQMEEMNSYVESIFNL